MARKNKKKSKQTKDPQPSSGKSQPLGSTSSNNPIELEDDVSGTMLTTNSRTNVNASNHNNLSAKQQEYISATSQLHKTVADNTISFLEAHAQLLNHMRLSIASLRECEASLKQCNTQISSWPSTLGEVKQLSDANKRQLKLKDAYLQTHLARTKYYFAYHSALGSIKETKRVAAENATLSRANSAEIAERIQSNFAGVPISKRPNEQYWMEGAKAFFNALEAALNAFAEAVSAGEQKATDDRFDLDFTEAVMQKVNALISAIDANGAASVDDAGAEIEKLLARSSSVVTDLIQVATSTLTTMEAAWKVYDKAFKETGKLAQANEVGYFQSLANAVADDKARFFFVAERPLQQTFRQFLLFGHTATQNHVKQFELVSNALAELSSSEKSWETLSLSDKTRNTLNEVKKLLSTERENLSEGKNSCLDVTSAVAGVVNAQTEAKFAIAIGRSDPLAHINAVETAVSGCDGAAMAQMVFTHQRETFLPFFALMGERLQEILDEVSAAPSTQLGATDGSTALTTKSQNVLSAVYGARQSLAFAEMYSPKSTTSFQKLAEYTGHVLDFIVQAVKSAKDSSGVTVRTVTLRKEPNKSLGLHLETTDGTKGVRIVSSMRNTVGRQVGRIHPDDALIAFNDEDVTGCSHDEVIAKIKAANGDLVFQFARQFRGDREVQLQRSKTLGYGFMFKSSGDHLEIIRVIPGSPAAQSRQLSNGQTILSVNGHDAKGMSKEDFVKHMTSAETVRLVVTSQADDEDESASQAQEDQPADSTDAADATNAVLSSASKISPPSYQESEAEAKPKEVERPKELDTTPVVVAAAKPAKPTGRRTVTFSKGDEPIGAKILDNKPGPGVCVAGFAKNSQADKNPNILKGDYICSINDIDVSNKTLGEVVQIFSGAKVGDKIVMVVDAEDPRTPAAPAQAQSEATQETVADSSGTRKVTVTREQGDSLGLRLAPANAEKKTGLKVHGVIANSVGEKHGIVSGETIVAANETRIHDLPYGDAIKVMSGLGEEFTLTLSGGEQQPSSAPKSPAKVPQEQAEPQQQEKEAQPAQAKDAAPEADDDDDKHAASMPVADTENSCSCYDPRTVVIKNPKGESLGLRLVPGDDKKGLHVQSLVEGSIGQRAGVLAGESICTANGTCINDLHYKDAIKVMQNLGEDITLTLFTPPIDPEGSRRVIIERLGGEPLGLHLRPDQNGNGLVVHDVAPQSLGESSGIARGEAIHSVNGTVVSDKPYADAVKAVASLGEKITFVVTKAEGKATAQPESTGTSAQPEPPQASSKKAPETEPATSTQAAVSEAECPYGPTRDVVVKRAEGESFGMKLIPLTKRMTGLAVHDVVQDSPAEKAGVQAGEALFTANDKPIASQKYKDALATMQSLGTEVKLALFTPDPSIVPNVTVADDTKQTPKKTDPLAFSTTHHTFTKPDSNPSASRTVVLKRSSEATPLGLRVSAWKPDGTGMFVFGLVSDSVAEKAGVVPGEVISSVNGTPIRDLPNIDGIKQMQKVKGDVILELFTPESSNLVFGCGHYMERTLVIKRGEGDILGLHVTGLQGGKGLYVSDLVQDSASEKAGVRVGDIIGAVDGRRVCDVDRESAIAAIKNTSGDVTVTLFSPPANSGHGVQETVIIPRTGNESLGIRLLPLEAGKGLFVNGTVAGSAAEKSSIRAGQIVHTINGKRVDDLRYEEGIKVLDETSGDATLTLFSSPTPYAHASERKVILNRGSGKTLGMRVMPGADGKGMVVYHVLEGQPAAHGGVLCGEVISAINGVSTRDLPHERALEVMQRASDPVNLTLLDPAPPAVGTTRVVAIPKKNHKSLGLELGHRRAGGVTIVRLTGDGAASETRSIFPLDRILRVNNQDVSNADAKEVIRLLAASEDPVVLHLMHENSPSSAPATADHHDKVRKIVIHQPPSSKTLGLQLASPDNGASTVVVAVVPGSPASNAQGHFHKKSKIVAVNGQSTAGKTHQEVLALLKNAGETVTLDIEKYRRRRSINPEASTAQAGTTETIRVTKKEGERLGICMCSITGDNGVSIAGLYPDSASVGTTLRPCDTILSVNGKSTKESNTDEVTQMLASPNTYDIEVLHQPVKSVKLTRKAGESLGIDMVTMKDTPGAYIGGCISNSPADQSGQLQRGDFVETVNGKDVCRSYQGEVISAFGNDATVDLTVIQGHKASREYVDSLTKSKPFSVVNNTTNPDVVEIYRDGKKIIVHKPEVIGTGGAGGKSYRRIHTVNFSHNPDNKLGLRFRTVSPDTGGVVVEGIGSTGELSAKGINAGDRLLSVNNVDVSRASHAEVVKAFQSYGESVIVFDSCKKRDKENDLVVLERADPSESFGLRLRTTDAHTVVDDIIPDSIACHSPLQINDEVLSINGIPVRGVSHVQILSLMRHDQLVLEVDSRDPQTTLALAQAKANARSQFRYKAPNVRHVHIDHDAGEAFGLKVGMSKHGHGVVVAEVVEGGRAAQTGQIYPGDVVLVCNGHPLLHATPEMSNAAISHHQEHLDIVVASDFPEQELVPISVTKSNPERPWGFTLLTQEGKPGTYVGHIFEDSPAYNAGLRIDDEVIMLNGENVTDSPHQNLKRELSKTSHAHMMVRRPVVDPRDAPNLMGSHPHNLASAHNPPVMDILALNPDVQPEPILTEVAFTKTPGEPVGVKFVVGENGPEVSRLEENGQAQRTQALHEGDVILALNEVDVTSVGNNAEVVSILKNTSDVKFLATDKPVFFGHAQPAEGADTQEGHLHVFRIIRSSDPIGLVVRTRDADNLSVVQEVRSNSPAEEAGVKVGDCILAVNGKHMEFLPHSVVREALSAPSVVLVTGRDITRCTTLTRDRAAEGQGTAPFGFEVEDCEDNDKNVVASVIDETYHEGPAERSGELFSGDVVLSVNGTPCVGKSAEEVDALINAQDTVEVVVAPAFSEVLGSYEGDLLGQYADTGDNVADLTVFGSSLSSEQLAMEKARADADGNEYMTIVGTSEEGGPSSMDRSELDGLVSDAKQALEERDAVVTELADLKEEMSRSEEARLSAESELVALKGQISDLTSAKAAAEKARDDASKDAEAANARISEVEASLSGNLVSSTEHEAQKKELEELRKKVAAAEATKTEEEGNLESIQGKMQGLEATVTSHEAALAEKDAQIAKQTEELEGLTKLQAVAEDEVKSLNEEVAELKAKLEKANEERNNERNKLKELEGAANSASEAQQKEQELKDALKRLEEEKAALEAKNQQLEKLKDDNEAASQARAEDEASAVAELQKQLDAKRSELTALSETIATTDEERNKQNAELAEANKKVADLERELFERQEALAGEVADKSAKIAELEEAVDDKDTLIEDLQSQLAQLNKDLEAATKPSKKPTKKSQSGRSVQSSSTASPGVLPPELRYKPNSSDATDVAVGQVATGMLVEGKHIKRVGPNKYQFFGDERTVHIRQVGRVTMVRIGGGWQDLREYLKAHENSQTHRKLTIKSIDKVRHSSQTRK